MSRLSDLFLKDDLSLNDRRELSEFMELLERDVNDVSFQFTGPLVTFASRVRFLRSIDIHTDGFSGSNVARGVQIINRAAGNLRGFIGLRSISTGRMNVGMSDPANTNTTVTAIDFLNVDNGRIHFFVTGSQIVSILKDTADSEVSQIDVLLRANGAKFTMGGNLTIVAGGASGVPTGETETVFNDGGHDLDFRIEGDTVTDVFKVDAGEDKVLIGGPKSTTGDPTGQEGMLYINTFDNAVRMYADGAWRTLASW